MAERAGGSTPSTFRDPWVLRGQVRDVLSFYHPESVDHRHGGLIAARDERDGHVYDPRTRHLVASARFVHNFAVGVLVDGPDWCRSVAEHGLRFLETAHWDADRRGYDWLLEGRETVDATRYCYGHAFVLLAAARALQAGVPGARRALDRADRVLAERFRDDRGLYAAEATPEWRLDDYRGLNANMHACEAHLAAYEATGERDHLDAATRVAAGLVRDPHERTDGGLWEHYTASWEPDYGHNRDRPRDQFRPWGVSPGHHAEWAKLLALLDEARADERGAADEPWLRERAAALFDAAVGPGWDDEHGGLYYTLDLDGEPVVADKYGWPVAEAIGAAAACSRLDGGRADHLDWYDRLWAHAREHLLNPRYGTWYRRLTRAHERDGPNRGVAVEPGYHPVSNALVALRTLDDDARRSEAR
jgi:mannose/cellobiose epimerase-like protein (N-acyl-D-glucosamine 2-epimerase family)